VPLFSFSVPDSVFVVSDFLHSVFLSRSQDVATVTALVLLFAEIGNAVGTAIASAIWRQHMPGQLEQHLAGILNSTEITGVYGSIYTAAAYKVSNPAAYEGIIEAYVRSPLFLLLSPLRSRTDFCSSALSLTP
jgi:hypothetical protein